MYKEVNVHDLLGKRQIYTWDYGKGSGEEEKSFSGWKGGNLKVVLLIFLILFFFFSWPEVPAIIKFILMWSSTAASGQTSLVQRPVLWEVVLCY